MSSMSSCQSTPSSTISINEKAMQALKRDPKFIQSKLVDKGQQRFVTENAFIDVPKRYLNRNLLEIKDQTFVFGVFALIVGDKYSVSLIPSMFRTTPLNIQEYKIGETEYVRLVYAKDTCIFENTEVVRKDVLSFNIFDEFWMAGKFPWYIDYEDPVKILDNMVEYAGSNVGRNLFANEITSSFVARVKGDMTKYFRTIAQGPTKDTRDKCAFNGIDDVFYSATSTLAKFAGNYYGDAVVSALVQPEKEIGEIEKAVRA